MQQISPDRLADSQAANDDAADDWSRVPLPDLIRHIISRYHDTHRAQLPELIQLARKVELVHAASPDCPVGLADSLEDLQQELESHMMKEEQILFPLILRGAYGQAQGPISVMRFEHGQHGQSMDDILVLTHDMTVPDDACGTWRGLYAGLVRFRNDLTNHIRLEDGVLFTKATNAVEGAHHG